MSRHLLAEAHALAQQGVPFAMATVVRCERPTSAKPGAKALIRADGTMQGWVGGSCAEPVVIKEALGALRDGQPRLVALVGEGGEGPGRREGVVEHPMTCHSGGTLEIYIEPVLPKPHLLLVGRGPVVATLAELGRAMEFAVTLVPSESAADRLSEIRMTPHTYVVVATHGTADEDALQHALRGDAGYVSLVASRRRAEAVRNTLGAMGVLAERLQRLKAPAGLDIGAVTPEEIAASIIAEIIQVSRGQGSEPLAAPEEVGEALSTDPICGMAVEVATARYRSEVSDRVFYFCCARCKQVFDQEPERYVGSVA
jgi:xanthine dehydrogenase accessory factor